MEDERGGQSGAKPTVNIQVLVDDADEGAVFILVHKADEQFKGVVAQPQVVFVLAVRWK